MWPGQFDDVKDVLTWIVDHPEDLEKADFSRIIIAGDGLGAAIGVSAAMQVAGNGIKKGEGKKKFLEVLTLIGKMTN